MGYYTNYTVEVQGSIDTEKFKERFEEVTGYAWAHLDNIKWYYWVEDMKQLSKEFSDTLFIVYGEGEESGDIWKAYFKNGKQQVSKAQIVFEDFDETKLV